MSKARQTNITVMLGGVSIYNDIAADLVDLTYTDHAHGQADELTLRLADPDGRYSDSWMPDKGDTLLAEFGVKDWSAPGDNRKLPTGKMEIAEVELSGPPDVVSIKAVSTAVTSSMRREKKTESWENTTLRQVAQDIAGSNNLMLMYEAPNISLKRTDQRRKSDLQYLQGLAERYGLHLKVTDFQMVIFGGQQFDALSTVTTIQRGKSWIKRYSFRTQSHELYSEAKVDYWDPEKKEKKTYTYAPEGELVSGQTLKINERVESLLQAEQIAKGELRKKNKMEFEGSFTLMGDPNLCAGLTVQVSGFGKFDGAWHIETSTHRAGPQGYETEIKVRKTLGY